MTPHNPAVAELLLVADAATARGLQLFEQHVTGTPVQPTQLEDHRTQVVGELLDAIDRIEPGLGTTLLLAMYPTTLGAH